jgi:hypothetical protein
MNGKVGEVENAGVARTFLSSLVFVPPSRHLSSALRALADCRKGNHFCNTLTVRRILGLRVGAEETDISSPQPLHEEELRENAPIAVRIELAIRR